MLSFYSICPIARNPLHQRPTTSHSPSAGEMKSGVFSDSYVWFLVIPTSIKTSCPFLVYISCTTSSKFALLRRCITGNCKPSFTSHIFLHPSSPCTILHGKSIGCIDESCDVNHRLANPHLCMLPQFRTSNTCMIVQLWHDACNLESRVPRRQTQGKTSNAGAPLDFARCWGGLHCPCYCVANGSWCFFIMSFFANRRLPCLFSRSWYVTTWRLSGASLPP